MAGNKWLKFEPDKAETRLVWEQGRYATITTVSRHRRTGELQGHLVRIDDGAGYDEVLFKRYYWREIAIMSAMTDYFLQTGSIIKT